VGPLRNVPTSLVVAGCATPLVLAAVLFLGLLAFGSSDEAPVAGAPTETPAVPTPPVVATPERARAQEPQPPRAPEPSAEPPAAVVEDTSAMPIPIEIGRDVVTVLDSGSRDERQAAARRVRDVAHPEAPPFVTALVDLELGARCTERRD